MPTIPVGLGADVFAGLRKRRALPGIMPGATADAFSGIIPSSTMLGGIPQATQPSHDEILRQLQVGIVRQQLGLPMREQDLQALAAHSRKVWEFQNRDALAGAEARLGQGQYPDEMGGVPTTTMPFGEAQGKLGSIGRTATEKARAGIKGTTIKERGTKLSLGYHRKGYEGPDEPYYRFMAKLRQDYRKARRAQARSSFNINAIDEFLPTRITLGSTGKGIPTRGVSLARGALWNPEW